MSKTSVVLRLVGSAVAVYLMFLFYCEKRQLFGSKPKRGTNDRTDGITVRKGDGDHTNAHKEPDQENEVSSEVTSSSSGTSYTSIDDEEMKSCKASSSSESAYSTASDDNPNGECTYHQALLGDVLNEGWHDVLNYPIVENHREDERMRRSPNFCKDMRVRRSPNCQSDTEDNLYVETDSHLCDLESTNIKSILVTYDNIVPPLKPNTGETIQSSNLSKVD